MRVEIAKKALKSYERIPEPERTQVRQGILNLRQDQHPPRSTRLINSEFYRIRSGSWRIIYHIEQDKDLVLVIQIKRRNEKTYKDI